MLYAILAACLLIVLLAVFPIPVWVSRALRGAGLAEPRFGGGREARGASGTREPSLIRDIERTHTLVTGQLPALADYIAVAPVASALAGASSDGWMQSLIQRHGEAEGEILEALDSLLTAMKSAPDATRVLLESSGHAASTLRERWLASQAFARHDGVAPEQHPGSAPGKREAKASLERYVAAVRDLDDMRAILLRAGDPYRG